MSLGKQRKPLLERRVGNDLDISQQKPAAAHALQNEQARAGLYRQRGCNSGMPAGGFSGQETLDHSERTSPARGHALGTHAGSTKVLRGSCSGAPRVLRERAGWYPPGRVRMKLGQQKHKGFLCSFSTSSFWFGLCTISCDKAAHHAATEETNVHAGETSPRCRRSA